MPCDSPFWVLPKARTEKVPVPCGRCPSCKFRRVNEWVFRLLQQDKISSAAHFVTLTYDTRSVPITSHGFMTLQKSDTQNFFKRLRKLLPKHEQIKYYICGEYGTQNLRPHYHAIIFGCSDPQLFVDAWRLDGVPIGQVHIGTVSSDSIAYTMKYIDKPGRIPMHSRDDRLKEFALMSKGLGLNYVDSTTIAYHNASDDRLFLTKQDGRRVAMPRIYRQRIYSDQKIKDQLPVIQAAIEKNTDLQFANWAESYVRPDGTFSFSFHQWREGFVLARHNKFYAAQKFKPRS